VTTKDNTMRTVTRTEFIGERVSDVDWTYDFRQHFDNHCATPERRDEFCAQSVAQFRKLVEDFKAGKNVWATTDGGWPRCGWGRVVDVGMEDGWPWWRPVPKVAIQGWQAVNWEPFYSVTSVEVRDPPPDTNHNR
jgi:hypothetical protein